MSDLMFYGVLRMPYEMAMSDEISRLQFWHRAQEAARRVEEAEAKIAASATPAPQAAPSEPRAVYWLEAEESARQQEPHYVVRSMAYSTKLHTSKPKTGNPIWPLFAAAPAVAITQAATSEPVGEVVMTASYSTYVRWTEGVTPASGTKLYAAPVAHLSGTTPNTEAPSVMTWWERIQQTIYAGKSREDLPLTAIIRHAENEIADLRAALSAQQAGVQEAPRNDLTAIYDMFGIGEQARSIGTLTTSIRNTLHFTDLLHAVEREFFMVPGEPDDECILNSWGSTTEQYIEQFRAALAALSASSEAPSEDAKPDPWPLIEEIAKQTPEKPDYWSSCGQCESNRNSADDLIEARAALAAATQTEKKP